MTFAKTNGGDALLQANESQATAVPEKRPGEPQPTTTWLRKRPQDLVKWLLPEPLRAALRVFVELRYVSNAPFQRLWSVLRAWFRAGSKPELAHPVSRVVFVCHGNIMRSPTAEAMLKREIEKQHITGVTVSSAGLHAVNGRSADLRAQTVAPEFGLSLREHTAQLLTPSLVTSSDLIIVMDIQNAAEFLLRFPDASKKLFMLRQFSERTRGVGRDIPDPYPGDEEFMRSCCGMLRNCIEGLTGELIAAQQRSASS